MSGFVCLLLVFPQTFLIYRESWKGRQRVQIKAWALNLGRTAHQSTSTRKQIEKTLVCLPFFPDESCTPNQYCICISCLFLYFSLYHSCALLERTDENRVMVLIYCVYDIPCTSPDNWFKWYLVPVLVHCIHDTSLYGRVYIRYLLVPILVQCIHESSLHRSRHITYTIPLCNSSGTVHCIHLVHGILTRMVPFTNPGTLFAWYLHGS